MTDKTVAAPDEHSSLVGGSSAARRLACPGSWSLEQKLPVSTKDESSDYADEGTACHACMSYALDNDIVDAEELRGMSFGREGHEYVMTTELIDDCIAPALAFFDSIVALDPDATWVVETRAEMPGIPNKKGEPGASFGTCDVIIRLPNLRRVVIPDWKFGSGVLVKAFYVRTDEEGEYEVPNAQLMFYGRAAMHTKPEMFEDIDEIELVICQPRAKDHDESVDARGISRTMTDKAELEEFRLALVRAIAEAIGPNPRIERGEHCRFAACKVICPKFLEPTLDLSKALQAVAVRKDTPLGDVFDFGDMLSAILAMSEVVKPMLASAMAQAQEYMEAGGEVPGYKLVAKKSAGRVWVETDKKVIDKLRGKDYALPDNEIFETKLLSPPQVEKHLKKRDKMLPKGYFDMKPSSGYTIAAIDDKRADVIPPGEIVERFAEKLLALKPAE